MGAGTTFNTLDRLTCAVPTRSRIQADAKDRVGTAHDRLSRNGNAVPAPLPTLQRRACLEPLVIDFDRQKVVGWILVVFATAFIVYFLKVRLFGSGPAIEGKEWVQFIGSFALLMIGTMNVRLATIRAERRKGRSE